MTDKDYYENKIARLERTVERLKINQNDLVETVKNILATNSSLIGTCMKHSEKIERMEKIIYDRDS